MQQLLTIITTAVLTYTFMLAVPYVKIKWNAFRNAKKRKFTNNTPYPVVQLQIQSLQKQMDDLQHQINNLVEVKYNRDRNRKNNIRRDVREYLKELQND